LRRSAGSLPSCTPMCECRPNQVIPAATAVQTVWGPARHRESSAYRRNRATRTRPFTTDHIGLTMALRSKCRNRD
ncbi:hypothetical protein CLOP_g3248, partial [Closterium sp. NIES-67]